MWVSEDEGAPDLRGLQSRPRPTARAVSRRLSSVASRRASPLDSGGPRCESIGRRLSATANCSTLTFRTCAECPPRGCPPYWESVCLSVCLSVYLSYTQYCLSRSRRPSRGFFSMPMCALVCANRNPRPGRASVLNVTSAQPPIEGAYLLKASSAAHSSVWVPSGVVVRRGG